MSRWQILFSFFCFVTLVIFSKKDRNKNAETMRKRKSWYMTMLAIDVFVLDWATNFSFSSTLDKSMNDMFALLT
jgi:EamA domain-containing membrane protein RarD